MFGGVSLILLGDVAPLSLNTDEEREIGAALAACLDTLPAPIGETVALVGPWGKLASTLGGAILKRMAAIAGAKAAQKLAAAQTLGPRGGAATVPTAPMPVDPSGAVHVNGRAAAYEVVAPTPMQL